jgi:hypothetical protein
MFIAKAAFDASVASAAAFPARAIALQDWRKAEVEYKETAKDVQESDEASSIGTHFSNIMKARRGMKHIVFLFPLFQSLCRTLFRRCTWAPSLTLLQF